MASAARALLRAEWLSIATFAAAVALAAGVADTAHDRWLTVGLTAAMMAFAWRADVLTRRSAARAERVRSLEWALWRAIRSEAQAVAAADDARDARP